MAKHCMKKCPVAFIIRKIQIETMWQYHDNPTMMAKKKKMENIKCW